MSNTPATTKPTRLPVDIVRVDEPWAIAYLADGSKAKVKIVFNAIWRELDAEGRPMSNPDGTPRFEVSATQAYAVEGGRKR